MYFRYSGTAFGITNAGGVVSSLLASMIAGLLTPNVGHSKYRILQEFPDRMRNVKQYMRYYK